MTFEEFSDKLLSDAKESFVNAASIDAFKAIQNLVLYKTGALRNSAVITQSEDGVTIKWTTPYAEDAFNHAAKHVTTQGTDDHWLDAFIHGEYSGHGDPPRSGTVETSLQTLKEKFLEDLVSKYR